MEGIPSLISRHVTPNLVISGHRRFIELAPSLVSRVKLKPITAEQRARLFSDFEQLDPRVAEGHALALTIVGRIAAYDA